MGKATKKKAMEAEAKRPNYSAFLLKTKAEQLKKYNDIVSFDPMSAIRGYANYAIKPLEEFVPRTHSLNAYTRIKELIRYVFNKYTPPAFLYQVWDPEYKPETVRPFSNINEDFKLWYIALAQGKSLYKEHTMGLLTKKETHFFSTCPFMLTIPEAIWYSVTLGMDENVSTSTARKIASTKLSRQSVNDFWKDVVRWFIKNPTTIKQMNDLLDYIGNRRGQNAEWHLRDMTLKNLIRHMEIWHREMYRVNTMVRHFEKWKGIDVNDSTLERAQGTKKHTWWKFHQITTGGELAEEGNKQHHCVSAYAVYCARGECSIWSLTQRDKIGNVSRALTIEIRGSTIVQARGYANRLPKVDEKSVLTEWASKCNFAIRT